MAFVDQMRAEGYAVESILIALNQGGLKIAARTLRAWCAPAGPSHLAPARMVTDALVENAVRQLAFAALCCLKPGSGQWTAQCARSNYPASCAGNDPEPRSRTPPTRGRRTCWTAT